MNILALDTSSKHFSLAVAKDGKTLRSRSILLKKVLSDSIMPAIQGILKKAGLTLANLDGFAVGLRAGFVYKLARRAFDRQGTGLRA